LLLIDPAPPYKAAELGFVAGIAAAHASREILCGDRRIRIKWPNDILHDNAKLCGILLESATLPNGHFACVAGIGVNCLVHPENARYAATDLSAISGYPTSPAKVFSELSAAMAQWLDVWAAGAGFEAIRAEWLSLAAGIGTWITVTRSSQTIEGTFETIDPGGRLVLAQPSGKLAIEAGDVFFLQQSENIAGAANG
jgi:BirA family biotin operon repressor/biotin-[acetyl-CoA-carboxylase] ligase